MEQEKEHKRKERTPAEAMQSLESNLSETNSFPAKQMKSHGTATTH